MSQEITPILDRILKRKKHVEEFIEKVRNNNELSDEEQNILIFSAITIDDMNEKYKLIKEIQSQQQNLIKEIQKEAKKKIKKKYKERINQEKKESAQHLAKMIIDGYDELHKNLHD